MNTKHPPPFILDAVITFLCYCLQHTSPSSPGHSPQGKPLESALKVQWKVFRTALRTQTGICSIKTLLLIPLLLLRSDQNDNVFSVLDIHQLLCGQCHYPQDHPHLPWINHKPWMNREVQSLLRLRDNASHTGQQPRPIWRGASGKLSAPIKKR